MRSVGLGRVLAGCLAGCLAACAPLADLRPPPQLSADRDAFVGGGAVAQVPRAWVDEPWRVSSQLWGGGRLSDRVELATVVAFDDRGTAAGVAVRWTAVGTDRASLGLELSVGWLWIALAVPVSLRVVGDTRVYAAPRFGNYGARWTPALPVGLSLGLPEDVAVRLEGQVAWPGFLLEERRFHLAGGVAGEL